MYIIFHCLFTIYVLSEYFDPEAPFDGVPLFMAYLVFTPPQLSPTSAMETDLSKVSF